MNLDLYEFETSGDASVDAGAPVEAAVAADPSEGSAAPESDALATGEAAAATEATTEPPAPAAPTIDWNDPLIQQQAAPYIQQQLAETLQQLGIGIPDPSSEPGAPEYDPFDPQSVQAYIDYQFQARENAQQQAQREVAQVSAYIEKAANANPALKGVEGAQDAITFAASGFDALAQAQTGRSQPQWAVEQAAQYLNTIVTNAKQAAVNEYKQSLTGDNGTQSDPAVNGAAIGIEPRPRTYDELQEKYERLSTV
jgi:hypothetical protein